MQTWKTWKTDLAIAGVSVVAAGLISCATLADAPAKLNTALDTADQAIESLSAAFAVECPADKPRPEQCEVIKTYLNEVIRARNSLEAQ